MKSVRIYRAHTENKAKVNTYLEYFDTMEQAIAAPEIDNPKWHCSKVRYEVYNSEKEKWLPA